MRGKVKWFNGKKGFGFIVNEDGKDIFCHYSGIKADGFRNLNADDEVEFSIQSGLKGEEAHDVVVIKSAEVGSETK